jgi:hypothetical protein
MMNTDNDQYKMEALREKRPEAVSAHRRYEIDEAFALLRPFARTEAAAVSEPARRYEQQVAHGMQRIDTPAQRAPEVQAEVTLLSERRDQDALSQIEQAVNLAYEQGQGNPLYDQEAA